MIAELKTALSDALAAFTGDGQKVNQERLDAWREVLKSKKDCAPPHQNPYLFEAVLIDWKGYDGWSWSLESVMDEQIEINGLGHDSRDDAMESLNRFVKRHGFIIYGTVKG